MLNSSQDETKKNPTGVHLDWHGLYTNPSAKVPTRECCCINTFSDEVGLCVSENDVVIVIVCLFGFFGKQTKGLGGVVLFFFMIIYHPLTSNF